MARRAERVNDVFRAPSVDRVCLAGFVFAHVKITYARRVEHVGRRERAVYFREQRSIGHAPGNDVFPFGKKRLWWPHAENSFWRKNRHELIVNRPTMY